MGESFKRDQIMCMLRLTKTNGIGHSGRAAKTPDPKKHKIVRHRVSSRHYSSRFTSPPHRGRTMSTDRTVPLLCYLRNLAAGQASQLPDRELLGQFIAGHDPTTFAALVSRHGPMIFHLCRRILRNDHDAEEIFQATFLVLARRAEAVRRHEFVGGWLYGVARRLASKARATAARRLARERSSSPRECRNPRLLSFPPYLSGIYAVAGNRSRA